jgi:hypothetical protein
MKPQAFTKNANSIVNSIITDAAMRQSANLCHNYKLACQEVRVLTLWDTGATGSSISKGLANYLGLKPIDMCLIQGVGGLQKSSVYLIDVLLPSNVAINNVRVTEFLDNGSFSMIIGMDIITLGDFAISNKDRKTMVSFRIPPSDNPIDFVQMINKEVT